MFQKSRKMKNLSGFFLIQTKVFIFTKRLYNPERSFIGAALAVIFSTYAACFKSIDYIIV